MKVRPQADVGSIWLRPARPQEAGRLTELAIRSKAYWGCDKAFLHMVRPGLTITAAKIAKERVTVAERDGVILGFTARSRAP